MAKDDQRQDYSKGSTRENKSLHEGDGKVFKMDGGTHEGARAGNSGLTGSSRLYPKSGREMHDVHDTHWNPCNMPASCYGIAGIENVESRPHRSIGRH